MSNDIKQALQQAAKKKATSQQFVHAGRGDTNETANAKPSTSKNANKGTVSTSAKRTKSVTIYLHDAELAALLRHIESDAQLREFNRQQALRKMLLRHV